MAYTASNFIARYPEFAGIIVPTGVTVLQTIQVLLDEVDADTSDDFASNRDKAVYLQVAHKLAIRHRINLAPYGIKDLSNPGVSSGKQAAGSSVSEQWALPVNLMMARGDWRSYYSRSVYGLEYLQLCDVSLTRGIGSF